MRNVVFFGFLALALSACGGSDKVDLQSNNGSVHDAIEAATGPLQDLNLRQQEIPQVLVNATANPYGHKKIVSCDDIKSEVSQLDDVLGADLTPTNITYASANENLIDHAREVSTDIRDTFDKKTESDGHDGIELPSRADMMDSAGGMAHEAVMGLIRSHTSFLPFRSIIRKISGAESHQKQLAAALEAGKMRRAYLKGMAEDKFGPQCLAKPIIIETKASVSVAKAEDAPAPSLPAHIEH